MLHGNNADLDKLEAMLAFVDLAGCERGPTRRHAHCCISGCGQIPHSTCHDWTEPLTVR